MTTNQTIDGVLVPRELALRILESIGFGEAMELRALLDAPASVESLVGRTGGGMVWHECAVCRTKGSYHPDVKWCVCGRPFELPAAQPQGVPIHQWSDDDGISWCDGNERSLQSAREAGWKTRTLYAEQPAPVAEQLIDRLAQRFPDLENMYTAEVFADWLRAELNPSL